MMPTAKANAKTQVYQVFIKATPEAIWDAEERAISLNLAARGRMNR